MERDDWGFESRVWGLEEEYDAGRMIQIYEAIKDLGVTSLVDVACGVGIVADGLQWVMPGVSMEQFDIVEYPEWRGLRLKPYVSDVMDFIREDKPFDVVLFLNSYRNWDNEPRALFDEWLKRNAKYFITSGIPGKVIGKDSKDHDIVLITL